MALFFMNVSDESHSIEELAKLLGDQGTKGPFGPGFLVLLEFGP